jgi:hypothetical protein
LGEEGGGRGEGEIEKEKISMECEMSRECLFYSDIYNRFFLVGTNLLRHVSHVQ